MKPDINHLYLNHNYGIDYNNVVSLSQVLSLICYCDLTFFSRAWSSTFRFIRII